MFDRIAGGDACAPGQTHADMRYSLLHGSRKLHSTIGNLSVVLCNKYNLVLCVLLISKAEGEAYLGGEVLALEIDGGVGIEVFLGGGEVFAIDFGFEIIKGTGVVVEQREA